MTCFQVGPDGIWAEAGSGSKHQGLATLGGIQPRPGSRLQPCDSLHASLHTACLTSAAAGEGAPTGQAHQDTCCISVCRAPTNTRHARRPLGLSGAAAEGAPSGRRAVVGAGMGGAAAPLAPPSTTRPPVSADTCTRLLLTSHALHAAAAAHAGAAAGGLGAIPARAARAAGQRLCGQHRGGTGWHSVHGSSASAGAADDNSSKVMHGHRSRVQAASCQTCLIAP